MIMHVYLLHPPAIFCAPETSKQKKEKRNKRENRKKVVIWYHCVDWSVYDDDI